MKVVKKKKYSTVLPHNNFVKKTSLWKAGVQKMLGNRGQSKKKIKISTESPLVVDQINIIFSHCLLYFHDHLCIQHCLIVMLVSH